MGIPISRVYTSFILQATSACTQSFGGRCVERCIIRHSRTIRGWYAQTDTGSTANGSGTNFRLCGRVGLAGALLGQAPAACWNLQILIRLYKKDDRSIFSMLLSSLDCLYAPGKGMIWLLYRDFLLPPQTAQEPSVFSLKKDEKKPRVLWNP